jgi:hypothetical protein
MSMRSNTHGCSTAMTAFTAVPRYWARWLRFYWWALQPLERVQSKFGRWVMAHLPTLKDVESLTALSMISFARWSIIDSPPSEGGADGPGTTYVLFETNFNGDNDSYLEAFSLVVPSSMRLTWRLGPLGSYHVPDVARVSGFLRYVNRAQLRPISGYRSAYPNASTKQVRLALELDPRIRHFDQNFRGADPDAFLREYTKLVAGSQTIRNPWRKPSRKVGALSILAPVIDSQRDELELQLQRLSDTTVELFPERTHFARWILVERRETRGTGYDRAPYLLFSAWFDYRPEELELSAADREEQGHRTYAKALYQSLGGRANTIWSNCTYEEVLQAPGNPDLPSQFWEFRRVKVGIPFYGYEGATVREIEEALLLTATFARFAVEAQGLAAADLQSKWVTTFPPSPVPEPLPSQPLQERVGP